MTMHETPEPNAAPTSGSAPSPSHEADHGPAQTPVTVQERGTPRRLLMILAAIGALLMVGIGAFIVTSVVMDRSDAQRNAQRVLAYVDKLPPASVPYVDGLVLAAEDDFFLLMLRNRTERRFCVRPPDSPHIDIQHAQTHAAFGQPVRIYYKRVSGKDCVVFMEDSPVAF
jgi:hypothetical protein